MNPQIQSPQAMGVNQGGQPVQQSSQMLSSYDQMPLIACSYVNKFNNMTIFGMSVCALEWTTANRIRLIRLDDATGRPLGVEFDIDPSQVTKISQNTYMLTIGIGGRDVRFDFAPRQGKGIVALGMALFGILGASIALASRTNKARQNGLDWWVEALRNAAPYAKVVNAAAMQAWIGLGIAGVIIFLAILAGIVSARLDGAL